MEQKKHYARNILIIAVVIVIFVLSVSFVRFGLININSTQVGEITVINGLAGNRFHITDIEAIENLVERANAISPLIGFRTGAPGYHYLLVFNAPDGSELERITLASENTIVIDDFMCYTNASSIIDYLSVLETDALHNG